MKPVTVDFETYGIEQRPEYPPTPVGVSIKYAGKKPVYYGFGHISGNNSTFNDARMEIHRAWKWEGGLLFQNGKFDVDVAEVFFGVPRLHWERYHDTLFLLFLNNPHQINLSLKESAKGLLGIEPEERDELGEWLVEHQPVPNVKISISKKSPTYYMKYLACAPVSLVAKYCNGDVVRTEAIFNVLYPDIINRGMERAYNRERELMPILLDMERQGVPINLSQLKKDIALYAGMLEKLEKRIRTKLKAPDLNLDSGEQLIDALILANKVNIHMLPRTEKTGKYQANKGALNFAVTDLVLLEELKYRSQLTTCLHTFMIPWRNTAKKSGGKIFTTWNQVRAQSGEGTIGARTGRLSSSPNFQNIPREFPVVKGLPALPNIRGYIQPFKGEVFLDRDYSQQELRILAHFEEGDLMAQYADDPWMDVHQSASDQLKARGLNYDRKKVKNTNFAIIYGMGYGELAKRNDTDVVSAKILKQAILKLYPGLKDLNAGMKELAAAKQPLTTWGGRKYKCEDAKELIWHDAAGRINKRMQTFEYKMINVLIQGSAADCTKQAIINFHRNRRSPEYKMLLTVHDELAISAPKYRAMEAMEDLRLAMESVEFDVPMLSEGTYSLVSWAKAVEYDSKGVIVKNLKGIS